MYTQCKGEKCFPATAMQFLSCSIACIEARHIETYLPVLILHLYTNTCSKMISILVIKYELCTVFFIRCGRKTEIKPNNKSMPVW